MALKQEIFSHCLQLVNSKIEVINAAMEEVNEGLKNDSKSSAGDKHETSRAMAQLENEKLARQLTEALEQKASLQALAKVTQTSKVTKGCLLKTGNQYIYISIALGRVTVNHQNVIVVSPNSPLGIILIGKKVTDTAELNGVKYFIESIE
jgi:transcription elongation GreA/GreB family factor